MTNGREQGRQMRAAGLVSSAVLTLAFASVIGFTAGFYLDRWLHSSPWFTLVLGVMGVVAGFRELIRMLNLLNQDEGPDNDSGPGEDAK